MVLTCNNICKSFITDVILDNVNLQINDKEKIALVGINGAGKSTLFKIITRELEKDSGEVVCSNTCSIGYLSQNAIIDSDKTIYDEILSAKEFIIEMEYELRELENEISRNSDNQVQLDYLTSKYSNLQHEFEVLDGYSYRSRVRGVIKGLGFSDDEFEKSVNVLSGGQKTRLALAKILVSKPDLLLLDEPTNHLDVSATEWLESYLTNYDGALIIISHDRYFLDRVVTKVVELENGKAKTYNGNYTFFATHKALDVETEEKHYENQQREIKNQEEIIKQLKSFNREKSLKRARSREKNLDKIERLDKPIHLNDTMHIQLKPKIESGNDIIQIKELKKSFDQQELFNNINIEIFKGERVALIGGNGTGKSTIFKIITGALPPSGGSYKLGTNVHIGYYDQEHSLLNPNNNLISEISDTYPDMKTSEIRNILAAFLFTGDDVYKQISSLSGGEKGRLTLVKLMLSKANFLLLDEPTNHLDITSKEVLEKALNSYTGTLFFISHDRYFINQIATSIFELTPNGINNYAGNYDYYIEKRDEKNNLLSKNENQVIDSIKPNKEQWLQKKEDETKKRKLEKQIEKLESNIHNTENRIKEIDELLCLEEVFVDHVRAYDLNNEKISLEESLLYLYEEWETLHIT